jgi:hypothetical protein
MPWRNLTLPTPNVEHSSVAWINSQAAILEMRRGSSISWRIFSDGIREIKMFSYLRPFYRVVRHPIFWKLDEHDGLPNLEAHVRRDSEWNRRCATLAGHLRVVLSLHSRYMIDIP